MNSAQNIDVNSIKSHKIYYHTKKRIFLYLQDVTVILNRLMINLVRLDKNMQATNESFSYPYDYFIRNCVKHEVKHELSYSDKLEALYEAFKKK